MPHGKIIEDRTYKMALQTYEGIAICPYCRKQRTEMFYHRQYVKNWIACDDCRPKFRNEDGFDGVKGLSLRHNRARRAGK